jgi:hypothetical protein
MSRAEILQLVGTLAAAMASVLAAVEARLVRRFKNDGATSRERAWELPALGMIGRWRFARLRGAGAIAEASPGSYYLDAEAYHQYRKRRRIRALVLVFLLVAAVLVIVAISKE